VVSEEEDFAGRINAGVDIFNVSGAAQTENIVRKIRAISATTPIMATGGREEQQIRKTIQAGANAITYTPPTTGELFRVIMNKYRSGQSYS
jgi:DNA-binding NarL/FixJ family response regulator